MNFVHRASSIYYNQRRLVNYTQDAVRGIAEQLDATSRMTWENRLALATIMAGKKKEYGDKLPITLKSSLWECVGDPDTYLQGEAGLSAIVSE
ncbi:hypothetical protein QTO34_000249, partial [Cnephaeus nilssonii]